LGQSVRRLVLPEDYSFDDMFFTQDLRLSRTFAIGTRGARISLSAAGPRDSRREVAITLITSLARPWLVNVWSGFIDRCLPEKPLPSV
jgi:hypothetical protein